MNQIIKFILIKISPLIGRHFDIVILLMLLSIMLSFFDLSVFNISMSFAPGLVLRNTEESNNQIKQNIQKEMEKESGQMLMKIKCINGQLADIQGGLDYIQDRLDDYCDKFIFFIYIVYKIVAYTIVIITCFSLLCYLLSSNLTASNIESASLTAFAPALVLHKSFSRMTKSELIDALHKKDVKVEETKVKTPIATHVDKKNKTVTQLFRESTIVSLPGALIGLALSHAHKLPILSGIVTTLNKWYEKILGGSYFIKS